MEPGDSDKIIFSIQELLRKPEISQKIIKNALEDVQKFSWENIVNEFVSVIKKYEIK